MPVPSPILPAALDESEPLTRFPGAGMDRGRGHSAHLVGPMADRRDLGNGAVTTDPDDPNDFDWEAACRDLPMVRPVPLRWGRTVYTGGTFDLMHRGHVNFLRQCREIAGPGGSVVVSLNTDEFIAGYKGSPPLMNYDERCAVLESMRCVDSVVPNTGGRDSKPAIRSVRPSFIVIGDDWAKKDYYSQMNFTQEWLDSQGIILIYVPYTRGISTTDFKARLLRL